MDPSTDRPTPLRTPLVVALAAFALFALLGAAAAQTTAGEGAASAADLPVTRLVLFTSGVGYFEHRGTVTGSTELELRVPRAQMDDLLQSLVVQDFGGGSVRPVRYPSREPLERRLGSYALDLSGNPTLAELLVQARGERVRLEAGETFEGAIVGVERRETPESTRVDLTLATDAGLQRVPLAEVRSLRFADPELRAEFDAALAALASARGDDTLPVRLRFEGEGEREVRVGYVREMPVWKTSYRLVLGGDATNGTANGPANEAELQGWAIVDNPTDLDLEGVEIAFVAGRPISFVTALYDPVYVPRPRVEVETGPALAPQADSGARAPAPELRAAPAASDALFESGLAPSQSAAEPGFGGGGFEALAEGSAAGATFVYRVRDPVDVGRYASAMIPVIRTAVSATEIADFDASLLPRTPLRGVRLVNDSELHLAPGTVTVFGPDGFRGAARLGEVVPGEARLLRYAADPSLDVATERGGAPERITAVRLRGATLETTVRRRAVTRYAVDRRGANDADAPPLLIEHPRASGFELVAPEPVPAETPTGYRFAVRFDEAAAADADDADANDDTLGIPVQLVCAPDEACELEVVEERVELRRTELVNAAGDRIAFLLENVELSPGDRATLERVVELQRELARLDREASNARGQIDAIYREQQRIRQNMGALERGSSLYRRYLNDLETQEAELDALELRLEELRTDRLGVQAELDALLAGLDPGTD